MAMPQGLWHRDRAQKNLTETIDEVGGVWTSHTHAGNKFVEDRSSRVAVRRNHRTRVDRSPVANRLSKLTTTLVDSFPRASQR